MSAKSKTPKATPSKAVAVAPPSNKSLALIDQELSQEIANIKEMVGQSGGSKQIKVEASGNFKTPDGLDLGNEIQIVVVDFSTRKTFYSRPFNPQSPESPDCYAVGKTIAAMKPEDPNIPSKQSDTCATCPLNQWGSSDNGRGKGCREFRDLAVLLVDPENPDAHNAPDAPLYVLSVPPTSLKAFDAVVPLVARTLNGPPIKALLTVTATNAGTYASLSFKNPLANPDYAAHAARRAETPDMLNRRYDYSNYNAAPPQRGRAPARPAPRVAAGGRR